MLIEKNHGISYGNPLPALRAAGPGPMALTEVLAFHGPNPSANHRPVALGSLRVQPLTSARCACRLQTPSSPTCTWVPVCVHVTLARTACTQHTLPYLHARLPSVLTLPTPPALHAHSLGTTTRQGLLQAGALGEAYYYLGSCMRPLMPLSWLLRAGPRG